MATQLSEKHPFEEYFITFDFTNGLESETLASVDDVSVVDELGADATATITDSGSQTNNTVAVSVWAMGGVYGKSYTFRVQIIGSAGSKYQINAVLPVLEH